MDVCRICGSDDKILIPIFENGDRQIDKEINACLPTKVTTREGTSVKICHTCASKLEICSGLLTVFKSTEVKRRQWNAKNNVCYICMSNKGTLGSLAQQDHYVQYITTDLSSQVNISRRSMNNICHHCAYKLDELHSLRKIVSDRESKASGGRPHSTRNNFIDLTAESPKRKSSNSDAVSRPQRTPRKSGIVKSMEIVDYCIQCREVSSYNKRSCPHGKQKVSHCTVKLIDCEKFSKDLNESGKRGRPKKTPDITLTRKRRRSPSVEIITRKRRRLSNDFNKSIELDNSRLMRTRHTSVAETSFESQKNASVNNSTERRRSSRKSDTQNEITSVNSELPAKRVRKRTSNFEFSPENKNIKSETIIKQRSARAITEKGHTEGRVPHVVLKIKRSKGRPQKDVEKQLNKSLENKESPIQESKSKRGRKSKTEMEPERSTRHNARNTEEEKPRPERNSVKRRKRITPYTCSECSQVYPSTVEGKIHMLAHMSPAVPVLKLIHCRPPTEEEKITDSTIDLISSDEEDLTEGTESRQIVTDLLNDVIESIVNDKVPLDTADQEDQTCETSVEENNTGDSIEANKNIPSANIIESSEGNEVISEATDIIHELENGSPEKEAPDSGDDSIEDNVTENSKDDHNSSYGDDTVDNTSKQTDNIEDNSHNMDNDDRIHYNTEDNADCDSHNVESNVGHYSHKLEDNVHDCRHNMEDIVDKNSYITEGSVVNDGSNMENNVYDSHNMEDNFDENKTDTSEDLHNTSSSSQEEVKSDAECHGTVDECSGNENDDQSTKINNTSVDNNTLHNVEDLNASDHSSVCSVVEVDDPDACNKSESGTEERSDNEVSPCEINLQSESVNGEVCDDVVGENSSDTDNEDYEEQNGCERPEEDINTGDIKCNISEKSNIINETSCHPAGLTEDYSPIHSDEDFGD